MIAAEGKACKDCGEWKPLSEFYRSRNRDGLTGNCRRCYCARNFAWRQRQQRRSGNSHIPKTKQCAKCGAVKRSQDFAIYRAAKDGLGRYCRECDNAVSRARRYGIPEDRVRIMAARTTCEACGSGFETSRHQHFDHRHSDGAVRGVLCFRCNGIVGDCLESPDHLRRVAAYLERTINVDYRKQQYPETGMQVGGH